MEEHIKSPFVNTRVIEKHVSGEDLIEKGVHYFGLMIKVAKESGKELEPAVLQGYVAGFTSTLLAIGFQNKSAIDLGTRLLKAILAVGGIGLCDDPNCDNCRKI